ARRPAADEAEAGLWCGRRWWSWRRRPWCRCRRPWRRTPLLSGGIPATLTFGESRANLTIMYLARAFERTPAFCFGGAGTRRNQDGQQTLDARVHSRHEPATRGRLPRAGLRLD